MLYTKTRFRIYIAIGALSWITLCQVVFYFIQSHYAEKVTLSLSNQFRSEFYSDNYQKLSNMVADITRSGFIRCSRLVRLDQQRVMIDFTSIQQDCSNLPNPILLSNVQKDLTIKSLSGTEYALSFQITNTGYFLSALWLIRIIGLILVGLVGLIFIINEKRKIFELNRLQEISNAKELISLKLAHDIRSPLSVLNLIYNRLESTETEVNELYTQAIGRINDIANELLNPPTKTTSTELNKAVQKILTEKKTLVKNSSLEWNLELSNDQIICEIDSVELERIISNLLNNSIEAVEKSTKIQKTIEVSTNKSTHQCLLKIRDNGCGISESHLKIIGSKRFSSGKEYSTSGGSGIGLYSANEYLKQIHGSLEVKSVLNEYTEVIIKVPLSKN